MGLIWCSRASRASADAVLLSNIRPGEVRRASPRAGSTRPQYALGSARPSTAASPRLLCMLILGVHSGYHEASACLFDDYRLVAAVALERLTRRKIDGGRVPIEAIDECLAIGGVTRAQIDAVVLGRGPFPWRYYTHFRGGRLVEGLVRQAIGREKHKSMERELGYAGRTDSEAIFDSTLFLAEHGFRADCALRFFNHHLAHALPTLFHTDWSEALLYTADGGGDNVQYSHRVFRAGRIETLYGGDEELLRPLRIDSVGLAYGYATQALGFRINRHEGKLTGLAAYGKP
ncbi:MAG: hypothetical protein FJX66_10740, partial [Alphaproteobacteria bacterium]|nr:hypothetical protein [Alphaproteobacteria bacterium]